MKIRFLMTAVTLALSGMATGAWAQGVWVQGAWSAATPRVDQRQAQQQQRIQKGIASGQITPREAAWLQAQQNHIAALEAAAKADGVVTPIERHRLERAQDQASHAIAQASHNPRRGHGYGGYHQGYDRHYRHDQHNGHYRHHGRHESHAY